MSDKSLELILPNKNETVVIASKPKTAALYYDKVWGPSHKAFYVKNVLPPEEVLFFGATKIEEYLLAMMDKAQNDDNEPFLPNSSLTNAEFGEIFGDIIDTPKNTKEEHIKQIFYRIINALMRAIANSITEKYEIPVATLFPENESQNLSYQEGNKEIISLSMENLKIVDEEKLTWEQVLELRNDKQSKDKYKRFIHWLDKEMIGKSQSFIEDDISIKLEDYEGALKKHGIKTVIGTVKEMLNSKDFLAGTALASSAIGYCNILSILL